MKRLIWLLCAAVLPLNAAYSQTGGVNCQQFNAPAAVTSEDNFYVIKAYCEQYYKDLLNRSPNVPMRDAMEASGFNSFNYWISLWEPQVAPYGGNLAAAQKVITDYDLSKQMKPRDAKPAGAISSISWTPLGPDGSSPLGYDGHMMALAFAPQSPNFMLAASSVGGVWFSDNSGASWQNGGMDTLPQASAQDCIVHPTKIDVWFCATGGAWTQSFGVYRTLDAGADWEYIGLNTQTCPGCSQIYKLVFKPDDPNTIYAATTSGVWQTTNALAAAGSVIWNQLTITPPNANMYDIKFQPRSSTNMYASGTILVQSTDAGKTWSPVPGTTFISPNLEAMAMAVTPANPNLLYLVVVNNTPPSHVWLDNAGTWIDKGPVQNTGSYNGANYGVRLGDQNSLAVSPTDPALLYVGDVEAARCPNGTDNNPCNWVNVQTGYIHADIREMKFSLDGTTVWAVTDGGLFRTTPSNNPWTDQNYGMAVGTVIGMAIAPIDPDIVLIGQYDNGTALSSDDGSWMWFIGGDGQVPMIDYVNPNYMYASFQYGYLFGSVDGGQDDFPYGAYPYQALSQAGWRTSSVLDSINPATFYAANYPEVWRTTNRGGNFTQISNFSSMYSNLFVYQLYTAPSNVSSQDDLYAFAVDESNNLAPHLFETTNANVSTPTWTEIALPTNVCGTGLPYSFLGGLAVDPDPMKNPGVFTIVYSGYCGQPRVFQYNPANCPNACWASLEKTGLPPITIGSLPGALAAEGPNGYLFVGTNFAGVYYTYPGMRTWEPYGNSLPSVAVTNLEINCTNNLMYAGTFGRGVWDISLAALGTCPF
jgi:hypothetical protein